MAVNAYVSINSKKYAVRITRYEPTEEKAQAVEVSVGGTHISQNFNFIEYRWGFDLAVPYTAVSDYGGMADLKTAYALNYCAFIDHYGNTHDVFFEGPILEIPDSPSLDGDAVFTVGVNLRKKQ